VLPPTSLRPYNDFYSAIFGARRRGTCGSVVQIGLKRTSNGKDDYSVATFRKLYDFSGEKLAQARRYADGFKEQIKFMLARRAADAANAEADVYDYSAAIESVADGMFTIGSEDYGEREKLPA
jgi:hypothetical protein